MIVNIVDHRSNKYDADIDAVVEPAWHDNSCDSASFFDEDDESFEYEDLVETTVEEAINYFNQKWPKVEMTLYIYDLGTLAESDVQISDASGKLSYLFPVHAQHRIKDRLDG